MQQNAKHGWLKNKSTNEDINTTNLHCIQLQTKIVTYKQQCTKIKQNKPFLTTPIIISKNITNIRCTSRDTDSNNNVVLYVKHQSTFNKPLIYWDHSKTGRIICQNEFEKTTI